MNGRRASMALRRTVAAVREWAACTCGYDALSDRERTCKVHPTPRPDPTLLVVIKPPCRVERTQALLRGKRLERQLDQLASVWLAHPSLYGDAGIEAAALLRHHRDGTP